MEKEIRYYKGGDPVEVLVKGKRKGKTGPVTWKVRYIAQRPVDAEEEFTTIPRLLWKESRLGKWAAKFTHCAHCGKEFGKEVHEKYPMPDGMLCENCFGPNLQKGLDKVNEMLATKGLDQSVEQIASCFREKQMREKDNGEKEKV